MPDKRQLSSLSLTTKGIRTVAHEDNFRMRVFAQLSVEETPCPTDMGAEAREAASSALRPTAASGEPGVTPEVVCNATGLSSLQRLS